MSNDVFAEQGQGIGKHIEVKLRLLTAPVGLGTGINTPPLKGYQDTAEILGRSRPLYPSFC